MKYADFRVSIVITSYNQEHYLIEAIESAINQTVSPHEIIIADDYSTDGSVECIRDYMSRYPGWIKGVFQKENVGIPKNRNTALAQVTGDYVSILDGDDRFLPQKNEREIQALQMHPGARAVYANIYFIDETGSQTEVRDKGPQPTGYIFKEVFGGKFGILRSMLIEYSALKDIGFLDPSFWHYDGFDLTVRFSKKYHITYIPDALSEIRMHLGGAAGWRTSADLLKELRGIYYKNKHLLTDLPFAERNYIRRVWSQRLFHFRLRDSLERGARVEALFLSLLGLAVGHLHLGELRQTVTSVTPEPLHRAIRLLGTKSKMNKA